MRVTILCEDRWIDEVREKAKLISGSHFSLKTPVSQTGQNPATHWMCVCEMTDQGYQKLIELKQHSIVSRSSPKLLLEELDLKIIK